MAHRGDLLLPVTLAVQATMLVPRIGLLPVWGDEQFTLDVIRAPVSRVLELLRADFHPPLYFLGLKLWISLGLAREVADGARLASVALALLATVAIDRLWLRELPLRLRGWFLALWVLSPFLLLYGRMARSYTAQLLVAAFAYRYAVDWLREPRTNTALRFALAESVLMYVHYLPGVVLGVGLGACGLYRIARGERERVRTLALAAGVCVTLYLPWMAALVTTAMRRAGAEMPRLAPSAMAERLIQVAYTGASLLIGETMPWYGLLLAAALAPPILWLLVRGAARLGEWRALVLVTILVAYPLTARLVIVSMTPSRLVFLLPLLLLLLVRGAEERPRLAAVVLPGLVATSVLGISGYHRQQGFLNKSYLLPVRAVAAAATGSPGEGPGLFLVDGSNIDPTAVLAALPPAMPALALASAESAEALRDRAAKNPPDRVWLLRSAHDVSPGQWSTRLATDLGRSLRCARREGYVAYEAVDRLAMGLLGWPERPGYAFELIAFERPPAGASAVTASPDAGCRASVAHPER